VTETRLQRAIEALLSDKRPRRGRLTEDEARTLRAAAQLRAEHPANSAPTPEFVDDLARRLRQPAAATSRRYFLRGAGLAAAAAVVGVAGDRIVNTLQENDHPTTKKQDLVLWNGGKWMAVTTLTALQTTPVVRFTTGSITGFVIHRNGEVMAMSAVCTHQGCILTAAGDFSRLDCPCHNQSFSLDGNPLPGDYTLAPLPNLKSRVNGDSVEVFVV